VPILLPHRTLSEEDGRSLDAAVERDGYVSRHREYYTPSHTAGRRRPRPGSGQFRSRHKPLYLRELSAGRPFGLELHSCTHNRSSAPIVPLDAEHVKLVCVMSMCLSSAATTTRICSFRNSAKKPLIAFLLLLEEPLVGPAPRLRNCGTVTPAGLETLRNCDRAQNPCFLNARV
jgi:hypothetical protein